MSFEDFSLIPVDDEVTPADDLAGVVEGALALPDTIQPAPEDPVEPLGRSWDFDWQTGQFRRGGGSPVPVSELETVAQWCEMALHSARYAHPVFSDDFGLEEPDSVVGHFPSTEAISDWQRAIIDALLVHDRITAVQNISLDWNPATGVLTVLSLDVITDTEETLTVSDVTLQAGGP